MPPSNIAKAGVQQRVELVRQMLLMRYSKAEIKQSISRKYGIKHRMVNRYVRRAQDIMLAESRQDRSDHVAEAYGFYLAITKNKEASDRDRLRAQERIDKLLGLESPTKYAHTDAAGNDVSQEDAGDMLADLVKRMRSRQSSAIESN